MPRGVLETLYFNAEKDNNGEYEGAVRLIKDNYGKYGFIDRFIREKSETIRKINAIIKQHLYAPLISVQAGSLKIQVSPVSMNTGEGYHNALYPHPICY